VREEVLRQELAQASGRPRWEWRDKETWRQFRATLQAKLWDAHDTGASEVTLDVDGEPFSVEPRTRAVRRPNGLASEVRVLSVERPLHWDIPGHLGGFSRTALNSETHDQYRHIEARFFETTRTDMYQIVRVELIRNDRLWERFCNTRQIFESNLNGKSNEKLLFHGTREEHINSITRHGFLRDFNQNAAYGRGTYFAKNAAYSLAERYTPPNTKGERFIILSRVLVGEVCRGKSGMTVPDEKPKGQVLYESMVDSLAAPTVHILSAGSDGQSYPEFVVTFKQLTPVRFKLKGFSTKNSEYNTVRYNGEYRCQGPTVNGMPAFKHVKLAVWICFISSIHKWALQLEPGKGKANWFRGSTLNVGKNGQYSATCAPWLKETRWRQIVGSKTLGGKKSWSWEDAPVVVEDIIMES